MPARARACDRHRRRPGAARGVQQPVHGDRRADGRDARQHRLLGQHQGAARLLLRAVRRRGQPDRQRAAHAGAPGLDGRERQDDHRSPRRARCDPATCSCSTRRTTAARTCPTSRSSRRCSRPRSRDFDAAANGQGASRGGSRLAAPEFYVASRGHHADIGGITPGSMPPDSTHVDEEGVLLDNVQLVAEGRFLEAEMRAILGGGRYPSRNIEQNLADLRAQVAACAKGADELAQDGRALRPAGRARLHAARAGQRRGGGAPRARRADRRPLRVRDGQRRDASRSRIAIDKRDARGDDRLHRHERAAADQLQRAVGRVQGGGAVRVPHAGRRRDPDERRVPEAARRS